MTADRTGGSQARVCHRVCAEGSMERQGTRTGPGIRSGRLGGEAEYVLLLVGSSSIFDVCNAEDSSDPNAKTAPPHLTPSEVIEEGTIGADGAALSGKKI